MFMGFPLLSLIVEILYCRLRSIPPFYQTIVSIINTSLQEYYINKNQAQLRYKIPRLLNLIFSTLFIEMCAVCFIQMYFCMREEKLHFLDTTYDMISSVFHNFLHMIEYRYIDRILFCGIMSKKCFVIICHRVVTSMRFTYIDGWSTRN